MIEQRLETTLTGMGYQRMNSNVPGIYLYYRREETELSVISVIHTASGNVLSKEQYEYVLEQLKKNLQSAYPQRLRLLSLILTADSGRDKQLCTENSQDSHWLIDLAFHRLMIYETQSNEFSDLRILLEELLAQEALSEEDSRREGYHGSENEYTQKDDQYYREAGSYNPHGGYNAYGNKAPGSNLINNLKNMLSPMNTAIILLNVIAFLVMNFAPVPGGEDRMLSEGALSWYFITEHKEYYRLLTSMFMHADFNHLGNNMLVLLFVGDKLERALGKLKFLFIYFSAGILAGITSISYNMWKEQGQFTGHSVYSIGASGAIFGIIGAMLYIVLRNRGRMRNISTRQMIFFAVFSLYGGIANARIDQAAHVGGFLAGLAAAVLVYRSRRRLVHEN